MERNAASGDGSAGECHRICEVDHLDAASTHAVSNQVNPHCFRESKISCSHFGVGAGRGKSRVRVARVSPTQRLPRHLRQKSSAHRDVQPNSTFAALVAAKVECAP
jgi:hypothetical protein